MSVTGRYIPYGVVPPANTTTVNVLEWAAGDGQNDDTAAIADAISYLPPEGGTLYFPAATYLISSTLFLPSNTTVLGDGPATVLKAIPGAGWVRNTTGSNSHTPGDFVAIFANVNWTSETVSDENYLFRNFSADLDGADSVQRKTLVYMVSARNIEAHSITTTGGGSVFVYLNCRTTNTHDNFCYDFHTCLADHFASCEDMFACRNYGRQLAIVNSNPILQFTGTTGNNTFAVSNRVVCTDNVVEVTGTNLANVGVISVTAAGAGGEVNDVLIANNYIDVGSRPAGGVVCYGDGDNWRITGNTIKNIADYTAILCFGNTYGTPTRVQVIGNRVIDCTRTSGGATLIAVTADGSTVLDNDILDCTATTGAALTDAAGYLRSGNTAGSTLTNAFTTSGSITVDGQFAGTWTPTLRFGGATTGIAYSAQTGYFVRQGNLVYLECRIVLTSKGSATGAATIAGIPYADPIGDTPPSRLLPTFVANTVGITEEPIITVSDDAVVLRSSIISPSNLDDTNFANNTNLSFCGWYRTG